MFEVDVATEVGAEMFVVDAGWFGSANSNWWQNTGDWECGDRLPNGLEPVFARARRNGLLCGMWFDLERLGTESRAAREHPEWRMQRYGRPTDTGDIDLTNPQALAHIEQALMRNIDRYQLDLFRLDYNSWPYEFGQTPRDGWRENAAWRYYEAVYGLYDRIAARYPGLLMENCSGGGGRTDLGMLSRFHYTWVSDWQHAPRSTRILNGMTIALPPERIDRNAGVGQDGHQRADLDYQLRTCLFSHFTLLGMYPAAGEGNPDLLARIRHAVALYKDFIRPFLPNCRVYHHTPVLKTREPQGWAAIEEAAEDGSRAAAGVFRTAGPAEESHTLRLRGVSAGRRYRVTFDNTGETVERDGAALMSEGLTIRLARAMTSELVLLQCDGKN
jgi:alpha-galactosidase